MSTTRLLPLLPSTPNYRFRCPLDGTLYIFDVRWNTRESAWYMDVLQQDETPIRNGMKIVLGANLGRASTDQFFQKYMLTPVDLANSGRDAGFDDIGTRVVVAVQSVTDILYPQL